MDIPVVLAIGGFDPSGGAGVLADIEVIGAHGAFGVAALTSNTGQDSSGVAWAAAPDADRLNAQLELLWRDFSPAAIKVGMLGSAAALEVVTSWILSIRAHGEVPVVVDPVLASTGGAPLLDEEGVRNLGALVACATLITPNLSEASRLSGLDLCEANGRRLADWFLERGAKAVLLKGGHATGAPSDFLFTERTLRAWCWERVAETPHGTGCATASAIAANLALGHPMEDAVDRALRYVQARIRDAVRLGHGRLFMVHRADEKPL